MNAKACDLASSNYYAFGPLKTTLGGKKFHSNNDLGSARFLSLGIEAQWRKCIGGNED